jgi:hypothetical protein
VGSVGFDPIISWVQYTFKFAGSKLLLPVG